MLQRLPMYKVCTSENAWSYELEGIFECDDADQPSHWLFLLILQSCQYLILSFLSPIARIVGQGTTRPLQAIDFVTSAYGDDTFGQLG